MQWDKSRGLRHSYGATALIEMTAAIALIGVMAWQAVPNTIEIRQSALYSVMISQMHTTQAAIEAEFAEASLTDPSRMYADSADMLLPYLPQGQLMFNVFDWTQENPIHVSLNTDNTWDLTGVTDPGQVFYATAPDATPSYDGYRIRANAEDGIISVSLKGGGVSF